MSISRINMSADDQVNRGRTLSSLKISISQRTFYYIKQVGHRRSKSWFPFVRDWEQTLQRWEQGGGCWEQEKWRHKKPGQHNFSQRGWKDRRGKLYIPHAAVVCNGPVRTLKCVVRTELMFILLTLKERKVTTNYVPKRARSDGHWVPQFGWCHLMYVHTS